MRTADQQLILITLALQHGSTVAQYATLPKAFRYTVPETQKS